MLNRTIKFALAGTAVAVGLAGCAGSTGPGPSDAQLNAKALEAMKAGFNEHGIAKLDRLNQDETQALCTQYASTTIPKDVAEKIEKANMAMIKPPSDGNYLGDWKRGEAVAQSGRGFQYSDDAKTVAGGNCYACHQLTKEEISYGTIGPSLYNFGKIRGFTPEMQKYAWGKVWNAQAYSACSYMPRFGHAGVLTEAQVKDVVALLMDPNSPVNK
jgi:sulfur-oxidizing protein SoxX